MNKFKVFFLVFLFLGLISFIFGWSVVYGNYDKQNKIILFVKKFIPSSIARKIRDTVFFIPDVITLNKDLSLQVTKYEQGYEGQLFEEKNINIFDAKYNFKNFFLPFKRLDVRKGYENKENTYRAHYLEVLEDKVLVLSGLGQTIYFDKKNINKPKLNQIEIKNNLLDLIEKENLEFYGVRDLLVSNNLVYISVIIKDFKGYTFHIYKSELNFKELSFEILFKINDFFDWSVSSGGRIEEFKDDKILFSLGYSNVIGAAQDPNRMLGKIISIDLKNGDYKIISMGHRNPQGLTYLKEKNLIINSEHGPKGGDEINFNYFDENKTPNYGWDIVSYGIEYDGTDPYKRPHKEYGFIEPFKVFETSIGISEVAYLSKDENILSNTLIASSLRAGSLYFLNVKEDLSKIIKEYRVNFGNQRIRDLKYDEIEKKLYILFELTPSIGILDLNN